MCDDELKYLTTPIDLCHTTREINNLLERNFLSQEKQG